MKIKSITPYQSKDGQSRWRIHLERDDRPLITGSQPSFKEGDEVSPDMLKLVSKRGIEYYVLAQAFRPRKFIKPKEQLIQSARTMALAYAKDLAVAGRIELDDILPLADKFVAWVHHGKNTTQSP